MSETFDPNKLTIKNIGPIEHFEMLFKPGTVTVLKGKNGSGKSTSLNAIGRVITGRKTKHDALSSRDGTTGGQVDFMGVRIKIARGGANKSAGECYAESVEGDLSIAELVDPGLKDPSAADAKRIKALVVLTGSEASPSMFHCLVDGDKELFDEIVGDEIEGETDILEMAGKVKRAFERRARDAESQAGKIDSDLSALRELIEGVDLSQECDAATLEKAADEARDVLRNLESEIDWHNKNRDAYQKAKESLAGPQPDIEEVLSRKDAIEKQCGEQEAVIKELEERLSKERSELAVLKERKSSIESEVASVRNAVAQRESLTELVEQFESRKAPTDEQVKQAEESLQAAKDARDLGVKIRSCKENQKEIESLTNRKAVLSRKAEDLRTSAKGTEEVLAEVVKKSCDMLRVDEEFRLVVKHPDRGECYFSELSEGERWKVGIQIAVEMFKSRLGEPEDGKISGMLAIPQPAWEGLDAKNRKIIIDSAAGTGISIVTAEANKSESEEDGLHASVAQ